jgi:hypothetical protein
MFVLSWHEIDVIVVMMLNTYEYMAFGVIESDLVIANVEMFS